VTVRGTRRWLAWAARWRGVHARSLGIGAKLTLGFGALAAVTLLLVALIFAAGGRATQDINLTEGVHGPASLASAQAQASLLRMQLHLRGYLVLGDPSDRDAYEAARASFEQQLGALARMSAQWPDEDPARWVAELTATYERWNKLPAQLFALHDNPLKNRPALRLARMDVQARRVQVLDEIDHIIELQKHREATPANRELLAAMLGFQTSFDAMVTNLMAYGTSGELNFKLAYGPQLATNASTWNTLRAAQSRMTREQVERLETIRTRRAEVGDLALRIVAILTGEHAYEDLFLYRTQVTPQAEGMMTLLAQVTAVQQAKLQDGLLRARHNLSQAQLQTAVASLVAIAFAVLMVFVFRRNIVGPVQRLTDVAEHVAGGDLSARAVVESGDEIGALATSINTMTQRLAQTIGDLETVIEEARRAKDAAEVANRAKSSFLANMSHELRTPLNAVLGYAQILQREQGLSPRAVAGLNTIRRSGEHLLNLINSVLDLARIEAGKIELFPDLLHLPTLARTVSDIIQIQAQEKNLRFVCDAPDDLPDTVLADGKRLGQVLLNLLSNAVKFTSTGSVRLNLRRLAGGDGSVRMRFEVVDTGIGIREDEMVRIFRPFEQAADVQRRYGGSGLGLVISQQLVGMMGGRIEVDSRPGEGSRFWFDLQMECPQAGQPAELDITAPRITGYLGPRRTVLVVDDVPGNRATMADFLSPLGFQVIEADNGQSGLMLALQEIPDLILMDSVMPVMDGLEATRRLRREPALSKVAVISVSASATTSDQQESQAAGANAFLPKPIDLDDLLQLIGQWLQLEWITAAAPGPASPAEGLVAPPAPEMAVLHHLAQVGNMRRIRERAEHLAALDPAYAPFATRLRTMADQYQSKAILDFISGFHESSG
jgi:signal transduction histidine kinase/DNA-binding NarL/FixJ family response regulator